MLLNIFFITFFIYFSFREQYQSINLPSFRRTQSNQVIVLFSKLSRRQLLILIYIYDKKDTFKVHPCNKNIYNQHNESINREKYHVSIDVLTWLRTRYFESNVRHAHNFFSINFKILLQFFVLSKKIPPPPQKIDNNKFNIASKYEFHSLPSLSLNIRKIKRSDKIAVSEGS